MKKEQRQALRKARRAANIAGRERWASNAVAVIEPEVIYTRPLPRPPRRDPRPYPVLDLVLELSRVARSFYVKFR